MRTTVQSTFETMKREMLWGTYGKGGVEHCAGNCPEHKFQWVRLIDRETDHLQAILRTQRHILHHPCLAVIHGILADRGVVPEAFSYQAEREMMDEISAASQRWKYARG